MRCAAVDSELASRKSVRKTPGSTVNNPLAGRLITDFRALPAAERNQAPEGGTRRRRR
ncbi:hypothetical protein F4558_001970 [Micromonospora profundi]|nr:hypothetical protein [Micromonospora profundi]